MFIKKFIDKKPFLISGPCSAESEVQILETAKAISPIIDVFRAGIWKPRTRPDSFQGVGEKGLKWLIRVQKELKLKVCTEVATPYHVEACLNAGIDMLWIGARTTVNPFYIEEIGQALKGVDIPIFIKNPTHPDLNLWLGSFERLNKFGITNMAAIHRGFFSYTKSTYRNDPQWEKIIQLRKENQNIPILCDPSHIAGNTAYIEDICQLAMDLDLNGLMIETHFSPKNALSDKQQQISPENLYCIIKNLILRKSNPTNKENIKKLESYRKVIDAHDEKILEMLKLRKDVVEEIARFKEKNQITIFQLSRWFEILKTRRYNAKQINLDEEMISEIFETIHKNSILTQTKIMRESRNKD